MWLKELSAATDIDVTPIKTTSGPQRLVLAIDKHRLKMVVEEQSRPPRPSELASFQPRLAALSEHGAPLMICPYVSHKAGEALTSHGWSWADLQGNASISHDGVRIRSRLTNEPPRTEVSRLPSGPKAWAVIRDLIEFDHHSIGALADSSGVSQPRTSQVVSQLESMAFLDRVDRKIAVDRRALLDAFLDSYHEPTKARSQWFYTLDSPNEAAEALHQLDPKGLLSGDPAADRIAAWMIPEKAVFYANDPTLNVDWVQAEGQADGNVLVVYDAADASIIESPNHSGVARWTQVAFDLIRLGGDGRDEAIEHLIASGLHG